MSFNPNCDRRTFLTALGLTTASTALPASVAFPSVRSASRPAKTPRTFVFASFAHHRMVANGGILTYEVRDGVWHDHEYPFELPPSEALVSHPTLPILYTAVSARNDRRRGSVTSVIIDPNNCISLDHCLAHSRHWLNQLNQQHLALATTWPRHLAISLDARTLLVADWQGRHYNFLPLASDGSILPVEHVLKQAVPAADGLMGPHSVLFHPEGIAAYASDLAADRLNFISLADGQPAVQHVVSFARNSGPAHLALTPDASHLLVSNRSRGGLSVVPLDSETGALGTPLPAHTLTPRGLAGPVAISSSGDRVYATTSHIAASGSKGRLTILHTLRLAGNGRLTSLARTELPVLSDANELTFLGPDLLVVGDGGIVTVPLTPRTGMPLDPALSVRSGNLTGVVLRSA